MSKFIDYLTGRDGNVYHAADVVTLQESIPELKNLPQQLVERMYSDFSNAHAASWLIVDRENIQQFCDWLLD